MMLLEGIGAKCYQNPGEHGCVKRGAEIILKRRGKECRGRRSRSKAKRKMNLRTRDITVGMTSKEVLPGFLIFINHGQFRVRLIVDLLE